MPDPVIDITLRDSGKKITGWSSFAFTSEIDSAANSFSLSIPFEDTEENRRIFKPYSEGVILIESGSTLLLRGYFEVVGYEYSPGGRTLSLAGRSGSGGILDWSAGAEYVFKPDRSGNKSAIYNGTNFSYNRRVDANSLMAQMARAHRIRFEPNIPKVGPVTIEPGQTLFEVISKIASVHGYFGVPEGADLVYKNDLGKTPSVVRIDEGTSAIRSLKTSHDVTKRFWRYICMGSSQVDTRKRGELTDDELRQAIRGVKIIKPEQETADYQKAAEFARSRSLIESYQVSVDVDGLSYVDKGGERALWKAGECVDLYAPGAAVYRPSKLIIKRATLSTDTNSGAHTSLDLGFPELYSGGFPEAFPWVS